MQSTPMETPRVNQRDTVDEVRENPFNLDVD
jgi:hypothetical protein